MSSENIHRTKAEILAGGPSLQEMAEFASRDFAMERIHREMKAIDEVHAAGVYPAKVGNWIVESPSKMRLTRPNPFPPSEPGDTGP